METVKDILAFAFIIGITAALTLFYVAMGAY